MVPSFLLPSPRSPQTLGVPVLPLYPSGLSFHHHMAFFPACVPSCVSLLTRTPVLLGEGSLPLQYDFIFTDSQFPKTQFPTRTHLEVLEVRTSTYHF